MNSDLVMPLMRAIQRCLPPRAAGVVFFEPGATLYPMLFKLIKVQIGDSLLYV